MLIATEYVSLAESVHEKLVFIYEYESLIPLVTDQPYETELVQVYLSEYAQLDVRYFTKRLFVPV